MRKLRRNKKAVSNIVGTILMILVVTVGMSILFSFFVTFVKNYQAGSGSSVMEMISIEDVWFNATGGNATIWLYNYGKVDVTVSTLYVNSISYNFTSMIIPVGEHMSTTVQYGNYSNGGSDGTPAWTQGGTYDFKFVTERGSVFEGDYTVPSVSG